MKSPVTVISGSRAELTERLASVMQASRAIRSEVALTICESCEMRLTSRRLRVDSLGAAKRSAARRRPVSAHQARSHQGLAHAITQILSGRGYTAFVASPQQDTALIQ